MTSRRYRQTNSAQALNETHRLTRLLHGSKLIRKEGADAVRVRVSVRVRVRVRIRVPVQVSVRVRVRVGDRVMSGSGFRVEARARVSVTHMDRVVAV